MATERKRMTFAITPDMEPIMDEAKKIFYDRTQSDMVRALITAGLRTLKTKNGAEDEANENSFEL